MPLDNSILSGKTPVKRKNVSVVNLGKEDSFKARKGASSKKDTRKPLPSKKK